MPGLVTRLGNAGAGSEASQTEPLPASLLPPRPRWLAPTSPATRCLSLYFKYSTQGQAKDTFCVT